MNSNLIKHLMPRLPTRTFLKAQFYRLLTQAQSKTGNLVGGL
jgi:hypothetical protein